jgi:hypothetical protein
MLKPSLWTPLQGGCGPSNYSDFKQLDNDDGCMPASFLQRDAGACPKAKTSNFVWEHKLLQYRIQSITKRQANTLYRELGMFLDDGELVELAEDSVEVALARWPLPAPIDRRDNMEG